MYFRITFALALLGVMASAGTVYTNSAAFQAAVSLSQTEDFGSLANGLDIASGTTVDGLTYSNFVLTLGATDLDITNQYFGLSSESLGADHTSLGSVYTYFAGAEGATITFASPVTAFGMFFNVNLNSGTYGFSSDVGSAITGSAAYDTGTFVFAGLVSDVPFTSIAFTSTGTDASFNVPELLVGNAIPEPSTAGLVAAAMGFSMWLLHRKRQRQVRPR